MKQVNGVEMATSTELRNVNLGSEVEIKAYKDGGFHICVDGIEINWANTKEEATALAKVYVIDNHMFVSGYGIHAGRKYWQLPEKIQRQVRKIAFNSTLNLNRGKS